MSVAVHLTRSLSGRTSQLVLDPAAIRWLRHGTRPQQPYSRAAIDLCEIARIVHEIDRLLPKRIVADRINAFRVTIPVYDPDRWRSVAPQLAELLHHQGNAVWSFEFSARPADASPSSPAGDKEDGREARRSAPDRICLFSGGLDSTSGLATLGKKSKSTLLFSYYTGNLGKQRKLAQVLDFEHHVQVQGTWRHAAPVRTGGSFNYRSFLFLALAAAEACANGVDEILQFENGPLALAVPPAPIYRVTRHAHPSVQRLAASIFSTILERPEMRIENPFLGNTKKEVVAHLRARAGSDETFLEIVSDTETCWYLKSRSIVGAVSKRPNTPCGCCIPCLVRKTALGDKDLACAIDLTKVDDQGLFNDVIRSNVDSYLDMAERMADASYGLPQFIREIPRLTSLYLLAGKGLSAEEAFAMFKRFSAEIIDTFPRAGTP